MMYKSSHTLAPLVRGAGSPQARLRGSSVTLGSFFAYNLYVSEPYLSLRHSFAVTPPSSEGGKGMRKLLICSIFFDRLILYTIQNIIQCRTPRKRLAVEAASCCSTKCLRSPAPEVRAGDRIILLYQNLNSESEISSFQEYEFQQPSPSKESCLGEAC